MQRTVGNAQISGNWGLRLLARLGQSHRFDLTFSRKGSRFLGQDLSLPVSGPLFQVYLPHFSGSRPGNTSSFSQPRAMEASFVRARPPTRSSTIGKQVQPCTTMPTN